MGGAFVALKLAGGAAGGVCAATSIPACLAAICAELEEVDGLLAVCTVQSSTLAFSIWLAPGWYADLLRSFAGGASP